LEVEQLYNALLRDKRLPRVLHVSNIS
jgi:hypothetical protein